LDAEVHEELAVATLKRSALEFELRDDRRLVRSTEAGATREAIEDVLEYGPFFW
jgi:hypothetical protein